MGRAPGPDSPPTITQWILASSRSGDGPMSGSYDKNRSGIPEGHGPIIEAQGEPGSPGLSWRMRIERDPGGVAMAAWQKAVLRMPIGVFIVVIVFTGWLSFPIAAQTADSKLIVPGERIGQLRLASRVADLEVTFGKGAPLHRGLWEFSTYYDWPAIGLSVIADDVTGNTLWIAVCACGSNPWVGYATAEGLALGATEEQVVSAMGTPSRTFADANAKSIYFAAKGIAFTVPFQGPRAGKVGELRIYWKFGAPGDLTVVGGSRISSLALGMTTDQAIAVLGGGYIRHTRGPRETYNWPHYGLAMIANNGVTDQVTAAWNQQLEDVGVKYSTAQGLGFDSTAEQIRSAFGEPAERVRQGDVDLWIYYSRGIAFGLSVGSRPGLVGGMTVFPPR